jgi:hypothetical protein
VRKNKARRETGFIRSNPKIIAQDILLATPNLNFTCNRGFGAQTSVPLAKNSNSSAENPAARILESGGFSEVEVAVLVESLCGVYQLGEFVRGGCLLGRGAAEAATYPFFIT